MKNLENRNGETNLPAIFLISILEKMSIFLFKVELRCSWMYRWLFQDNYLRELWTNNKAVTVALISMETVKLYGWLSCVRSDCGVENVDVAR